MAIAKYSKKITGEAKKHKLSIQEMAMATLMAHGWADDDAYKVTGLWQPLMSDTANMAALVRTTTDNQKFITYLEYAKTLIGADNTRGGNDTPKEEDTLTEEQMKERLSKEYQLRELLVALDKAQQGTKEWIDLKKMIADITQAKRDDSMDAPEDDTIHYYLPLSCRDCNLYMKAVARAEREARRQQE